MGLTHFPHGVSSFGVPVLPGVGSGIYSGDTFFVDSGAGSDSNLGTFEKPFGTIDYAVGKCTANNGDTIYVKEGHVEAVTAVSGAVGGLDLDVAGITIEFLGAGNGRGSVTFSAVVGADMNVDAADITLINPRFVAALNALTGPIDVNAARFKMYGATWQDGTTINTTDCVVADANADDMVIDGFEFIDGDAAGTQKQSFIQVAAATRPTLKNIRCTGDFATGIIENGTAWIDAYLEDIVIDNANAVPTVGMLLQLTSSGQARNCYIRVASGTTYVTADNDMQFFECFGTGTDATAGEKIGTILAGDLEAKIDVIDGYFDAPTADAATDTTIRDAIGRKTDAAVTVVAATKTLMAYLKGAINWLTVGVADAVSNASAADVVGNKTDAQVVAVGTTKSVIAYLKGLIVNTIVSAADTANNIAVNDVVGNKTDASVYVPGTTKALAAYAKGTADLQEKVVLKAAATMVNAQVLFTVAGGSILIDGLVSECVTANDATASTLQYSATPTVGAATTISAATTTLASVAAGYSISILGTALSTVPALSVGGPNLGMTAPLVVPAGTITAVVGVGSTTGTWKHYLKYRPLAVGVTVS